MCLRNHQQHSADLVASVIRARGPVLGDIPARSIRAHHIAHARWELGARPFARSLPVRAGRLRLQADAQPQHPIKLAYMATNYEAARLLTAPGRRLRQAGERTDVEAGGPPHASSSRARPRSSNHDLAIGPRGSAT